MEIFLTFLSIGFITIIIISANLCESGQNLEALVKSLLTILTGMLLFVGLMALNSAYMPQVDMPMIEKNTALLFFTVSTLSSIFCFCLIFFRPFRLFLQRYMIRSEPGIRYYHADSLVHTTALILMVFALVYTVGNFVLGGGVEGIAETLQESGMSIGDLLLNMSLYLIGALFGIGVLLRRNLRESLERLGIQFSLRKNLEHILIGIFVGFGLFWLQVFLGTIWQSLVSPETLQEQTAAAEQVFSAFSGSIWLGLLMALTAGIGEELLFRGALQPIFGNLLVSLFFVSLHSQYLLTPASLIILLVSIGFGYLRQNYSTNASIVAHFVYNFSPFVMLYFASQLGISL